MALTKQQQARRRSGVGASEIAVIAGLSKWSSPVRIYEAKVAGVSLTPTYAMELGSEMEAPIARVWAKQHAKALALVDTLQHPERPFALATPDRAVYADPVLRGDARRRRVDVRDAECLLQIKSTNWRMRRLWGEPGTDQIPDEYLAQAHWEGAVAGLSEVRFAVDFDKTELLEWRVKVDPDVFGALYELAERFMRDHVERRVPPPPDGSEAWGEHLARVFPRDTSPALVRIEPGTEPEVERAVAEFLMLKAADSRLKRMKERAYQTIAARIGDAAGIEGAFGRVTWKRTKDTTAVRWSALADDLMGYLRSLGVTEENLAGLLGKHTVTKPGHRTMRTTPAPHLQFTAPIELLLEQPANALATTEEENP